MTSIKASKCKTNQRVSKSFSREACGIGRFCLTRALIGGDLTDCQGMVTAHKSTMPGDILFAQGQKRDALYVVKFGSFKLTRVDEQGNEQITGFALPGELLGLEDIDADCYPMMATPLEKSWVCEFSMKQMDEAMSDDEPMLREVLSYYARQIETQQQLIRQISSQDAASRLLFFLRQMSARYQQRGWQGHQFRLPMDRIDIANYLGMKLETVSRSFSSLQKDGWIDVHGKSVELLWDIEPDHPAAGTIELWPRTG